MRLHGSKRASVFRKRKIENARCVTRGHCPSGKVTYPNKALAKSAAGTLVDHRGVLLDPYRCPKCHLWHLTGKAYRAERAS